VATNALEIIGPVPRGVPKWEYDESIGREICERLANGESLRRICQDAGMPGRTKVYDWLEENDDFANQYARAIRLQANSFADDLHEVALDLGILPEHKRIIVDAMKWRAARQNALLWGDKVTHEHRHRQNAALGADRVPESLTWLTGQLHGDEPASGPGPDHSDVGEE
jgi:hypothetical protein